MNCCLNPYEIPINGAWLIEESLNGSSDRSYILASIAMRLNNIWENKERTSLFSHCREYIENGEKILKLQLKHMLRD